MKKPQNNLQNLYILVGLAIVLASFSIFQNYTSSNQMSSSHLYEELSTVRDQVQKLEIQVNGIEDISITQQGPQGEQGPSGVSGYELIKNNAMLELHEFNTIEIACPDGKLLLSGGCYIDEHQTTSDANIFKQGRAVLEAQWQCNFDYIEASPLNPENQIKAWAYAICADIEE